MVELLREIKAKITSLDFELIPKDLPEQVIVSGEVQKEIFYVTKAGLVKKQDAALPFVLNFELWGIPLNPEPQISGKIEHINYRLAADGKEVEQQYIISITLSPEELNLKRQHFLISSTDKFTEEEFNKPVPDRREKTKLNHAIQPIPLPDLAVLIDQKVQVECDKLEKKLKKVFQKELAEAEQRLAEQEKKAAQHKKRVFQKIHGYKTKVYSF